MHAFFIAIKRPIRGLFPDRYSNRSEHILIVSPDGTDSYRNVRVVFLTLSKKHPETGEAAPAGHTYVIGVLGNKKKWYEINSGKLNGLSDEDLQKELFKILHPQTHH